MRFVAFDLETTGFLPGVDKIVEIGAVRFENGQPTASFVTLVDPERTMPAGAREVTGITDDMLVNQPKIETLLQPFAEFCGEDMLVAHNAPFDFQFMRASIELHEGVAPKGIVLDTCSMARKVLPGLINYKLGTLVQHLKINAGSFHRAEADASYCGQLFWKMIEKLTTGSEAPAIENLIALSNNTALRFPVIEKQPKQLDLLTDI